MHRSRHIRDYPIREIISTDATVSRLMQAQSVVSIISKSSGKSLRRSVSIESSAVSQVGSFAAFDPCVFVTAGNWQGEYSTYDSLIGGVYNSWRNPNNWWEEQGSDSQARVSPSLRTPYSLEPYYNCWRDSSLAAVAPLLASSI